jgi:hypothetical protein
MRAGSNFVPAPHGVLAQLFGRRPRAFVFNWWLLGAATVHEEPRGTIVSFDVGFLLTSRGPGLARGLYFSLTALAPEGGSEIGFEPGNRAEWTGNSALFGLRIGLVAKETFRLAPEAVTQPLLLHVRLAPPFVSDFVWTAWYGHDESPVTRIGERVPAATVAEAYRIFLEQRDAPEARARLIRTVMSIKPAGEPGPEGYDDIETV